MATISAPISDIRVPPDCHPLVRQAVEYWLSIHPESGLPGRQHFDPVDVPELLPNLCLIDVAPDKSEFTFRLMGTRLVEFFGGDFTGEKFEKAFADAHQAPAYKDLCDAIAAKEPRWRRGRAFHVTSRRHVEIERVHLPFATDGHNVDMTAVYMLARYLDGAVR